MNESINLSVAAGNGSSAAASRRGGGDPDTILVELCDEVQFTSNGAGAYTAHPEGPTILGLGPRIVDIVIHANGRGFSSGFKYKVTAQRSYDGVTWTAFAAAVLTEQTAAGYVVSTAYSTRTDFGLRLRFSVEVNDAGTAKEVGVLSVTAAIRLYR